MKLEETLVGLVPDPCAVLDSKGIVRQANAGFRELFPNKGDPVIGADLSAIGTAAGTETPGDLVALARESPGETLTREVWIAARGTSTDLRLSIRAMADAAEPLSFLVTLQTRSPAGIPAPPALSGTEPDLTPAEAALSGRKWHRTGQLSGENWFGGEAGVFTWDLVTGELTVSSSLMRSLDYDLAQIDDLMAFFMTIYHPDDLARYDTVLQASMQDRRPYSTTIRLQARDGRFHHFLLRGQPICDEDDKVIMMIGTEADITEQVDLNIKLLRAEAIAKLGSWTHHLKTDEMNWSPEMHRIVGHEGGDYAARMSLSDIPFHPEDAALAHEFNARLLQRWKLAPDVVERIRLRILHPDGSTRHCEISGTIELDALGQPLGSVGTLQDITDLVEAEQRLLMSQKMEVIGKLAGGAAHDFNNLLAVIMGNLELVEDTMDQAERDDFVRNALDAANRGADLTRNLLSFARKAVLNPSRLDLNATAAGMMLVLKRVIPESIKIEVKADPALWTVHADRSAFTNALLNLAINARDAMPGGGVITLESENKVLTEAYLEERQEPLLPGPYVVFSLSDTGTGIPPDLLGEVFAPYFTTKPVEMGSGLGLSMVHGFMRQTGGAVRLYSELGVGTTVKLFFPAMALDASVEVEERATAPDRTFAGRVLLAEDNDEVRQVLTRRLATMGLDCTGAASGDDALELHRRDGPFDLLVTDVVMPGSLQGPDLARALRDRQPDLKVIFITGYPNEATIHGNGLRKEDIRLMKPISKVDLIRAVDQVLRRAAPTE